jgi:hypothetical protein
MELLNWKLRNFFKIVFFSSRDGSHAEILIFLNDTQSYFLAPETVRGAGFEPGTAAFSVCLRKLSWITMYCF